MNCINVVKRSKFQISCVMRKHDAAFFMQTKIHTDISAIVRLEEGKESASIMILLDKNWSSDIIIVKWRVLPMKWTCETEYFHCDGYYQRAML